MVTLRPTKMLARRLHLTVPAAPPPVTNRVADWCAHEFTASRHRYLLFWNTAAFLPVLVPGRGVRDDHDLIMRLVDGLKLVMSGPDLEFYFPRWIVPELGEVQWAPIPSRSVLGTLNDFMIMAKYHLTARNQSPPGNRGADGPGPAGRPRHELPRQSLSLAAGVNLRFATPSS